MKPGLVIVVLLLVLAGPVFAQNVSKSSEQDQAAVSVTVYNSNLGLVKDLRKITLPTGEGELRFMDVAAYIRPETVHVKSLSAPEKFGILEQNYEYDLINQQKLLDKYVGKKVKLLNWNQFQDRREKEEVEATLVSNNSGPIYQIDKEIYLGHPGYVVLPQLPENLIAQPTLTWMYKNSEEKAHQVEVSYLTGGIGWKADYVFVVNKDDTAGDLAGWVTLDNQSGATYRDAKLKLVAGEVQQVQPSVVGYARKAESMMMNEDKGGFAEQGFFEYHLYDLQRKTTIKDKQTKQISLLEATGVKAQKELLVYGVQSYYTMHYRPQNPKQPVSVYIKFKNAEDNRLGMPLPAGIMRLYKEDNSGSLQFIGEDRIEHTPKDEEVRLKVGEAFDVVAERKQTDYKLLLSDTHESEWEITLRNHKKEDIRVGIVEPLYGSWQVMTSTHPFTKVDAFTLRFDVDVPKDGEVKVLYRIRVRM